MKIKNNVKCFISMIAIILYPSMFMYFQNMSEGHFIEILPSIGKNLYNSRNCVFRSHSFQPDKFNSTDINQ